MKIVKTRLRNKITDEWMNDCLVTYIEKEMFDNTNSEDSLKCHPPRFHTLTHNCEDTSEKNNQNDESVRLVDVDKLKGYGIQSGRVIANLSEELILETRREKRKWRLTGKNMMIIGVYAPQEGKEKQALWDFLSFRVLDFPNQNSHEQSDQKERRYLMDEIKKTVWECVTDKAPCSVLPLVSLSLPLVSLSFQPRIYSLSTLPFPDSVQTWKIPENNLDVLAFPKNNLDVLKFLENNLEVLTIQKKNLYGA
ncbi:hypothetical protein Tco_1027520 [Tanacetum coccineum]